MSKDDGWSLYCKNCGSRGRFRASERLERVVSMNSDFTEVVVEVEPEVVDTNFYACVQCGAEGARGIGMEKITEGEVKRS